MPRYWHCHKKYQRKCRYICRILSHSRFNESVKNSIFPSILKQANITPVFKKGWKKCKNNYKPASVLSNASKVDYLDYYISKYQCRFRKCYSTQNYLLFMH